MDPFKFGELVAQMVNDGSMRRYCKSRLWGGPKQGYGGVATADRISRYGGTAIAERILRFTEVVNPSLRIS